MLHGSSVARNNNFIFRRGSSTNLNLYNPSPMYYRCIVAKNIYFFDVGRVPIKFFPSPMHHRSAVARKDYFFFGEARVSIEFFLF